MPAARTTSEFDHGFARDAAQHSAPRGVRRVISEIGREPETIARGEAEQTDEQRHLGERQQTVGGADQAGQAADEDSKLIACGADQDQHAHCSERGEFAAGGCRYGRRRGHDDD